MSLTVGFACTCLLVSFLVGETNADSFHSGKDKVFEVYSNDPFSGGDGKIVFTIRGTRDHLVNNYPEVESACQLSDIAGSEIEVGDNITPLQVISSDTSFFSLFDFPLISGSKKGLTAGGIILSSEKAKQIFGTEAVLGKLVNLRTPDTAKVLTITGVIGKAKEKSHLRFDALMDRSLFEGVGQNRPGGVTYVLLRDGADVNELQTKVNNDKLMPSLMGDGQLKYGFDPLSTAYFNPFNRFPFMQNRSETFVWIGWIVCGVILFMASFNFVNLFLLSIHERKKETGIQRTLGISLWQTIRSTTVEAGMYIGISFVLSVMLAYTLIPIFNNALTTELELAYLLRPEVLLFIGSGLCLIVLVVTVVSTFQKMRTLPVSMMRNVSAKVRYSKLFFTVQFFVSITLSVCTITLVKQMRFLENEPLGFNRNLVQLTAPGKNSPDRIVGLKTSLAQIPGVEHVAQSAGNPISANTMVFYELEDKSTYSPYIFSGDGDLLKTLDLKLVEGNLDLRNGTDHIVNETLIKKFNIKEPIGTIIPGTKQDRITGVVRDFTCSSFKQEIPPVIISYTDKNSKYLLIDYGRSDIDVLLPKIRTAWAQIFPDDLFEFKIIQQDLMKKYSEETMFYQVALAASMTSMIISCFGMFALSWAVIRSRAKELGIRKVLGASVGHIAGLLTISFAKRLAFAFLLAGPAGYYLMNIWLSRFVYKAPIDSWVFVITGAGLASIAILTLGIQTIKASISSPLEEIRE